MEKMERPSKRELFKKLKQAKEAVSSDSLLIINSEVIAEDALDLGYLVIDLKNVLLTLFDEIDPDHYAGNYPPKKSYESQIKGSELFAFRWKSKYFGCKVYLKYSLKGEKLYLVSLHQHRLMKGG
jgi:hypothetical protein